MGRGHSIKAFNPGEFFELAASALFMQAVRSLRITVPRTLLSEDRRFCTTERFNLTMGGIYLDVEVFLNVSLLFIISVPGSDIRLALPMTSLK